MMQEACRKDVERAFGVLQARFKILARPSRLWFLHDMHTTIKVSVSFVMLVKQKHKFIVQVVVVVAVMF